MTTATLTAQSLPAYMRTCAAMYDLSAETIAERMGTTPQLVEGWFGGQESPSLRALVGFHKACRGRGSTNRAAEVMDLPGATLLLMERSRDQLDYDINKELERRDSLKWGLAGEHGPEKAIAMVEAQFPTTLLATVLFPADPTQDSEEGADPTPTQATRDDVPGGEPTPEEQTS